MATLLLEMWQLRQNTTIIMTINNSCTNAPAQT